MLRHLFRQCLRTTTRTFGDVALHVAVYRYARRMMREHPKLADHIRHSYETVVTAPDHDRVTLDEATYRAERSLATGALARVEH